MINQIIHSTSAVIRLLIVEDHTALAANLADFFERPQPRYQLDFAQDGWQALHLLSTASYDVVVLDVMLPGLSGFEICKRLRSDLRSQIPVIMLTARDQIENKTLGFIAGADDYLVKPFNLQELEMRILALYRRSQLTTDILQVGNLRFDLGQQQAWLKTQPLELTPIAARILESLLRAYPRMLSYQQLAQQVWGEADVDLPTLRTHVYALRKILQQPQADIRIHTVQGRGYRIIVEAPV